LVLLTKSDFLDMIDDFDTEKAERHVRELANPAPVLKLSVRRPQSLEGWLDWLRQMLASRKQGVALSPKIQQDGATLHVTS